MEKKKIKKGDTCVVVERYSGSKGKNPIESKITSAGPKWIYVKCFYRANKFDAETLCSDWGSYDLYPCTIEEYNEAIRMNEIKKKLIEEINSSIQNLSVCNLQKVKDLIECLSE